MKADDILQEGRKLLVQRGVQRDQPEGERSMPAVIAAFNALSGHQLTEQQGWLLMALVKIKRSQTGKPDADHYVDGANYIALAGEAALAAAAELRVGAALRAALTLSADGTLNTRYRSHNIEDIPEDLCPVCVGTGYADQDSGTHCQTCTGTGLG